MMLMICLTTTPVLIVTWIATDNTRNAMEEEIVEASVSRMGWANQYLDDLVAQIDVLFYSLQINEELMERLILSDDLKEVDQFRNQRYIQETLISTFYSYSRKIDELALYSHSNQRVYTVNFATSGLIYSLNIEKGPWDRMLKGPISLYFKQAGNHLHAFHSMNRFEDQALLGGVSVRINDRIWEELSDILGADEDSPIFLLNDEGTLLKGSSSTQDETLISLYQEQLRSGVEYSKTDNYYLFTKQVYRGALKLVKAVPISTVSESANDTVRAGLMSGLLFATLAAVASIVFSLRISRPIVSLARTMRKTPIHQFEMKLVQSRDEIGLLEHGYNSMMKRIKELIENEYLREIEVKEAQLMALQAQINPHFLNNTLNLIGGIALTKQVPEIYKITKGIGDLLRYSISTEDKLASLEDEVRHVRNYLFIQEQRFLGRCTVQMDTIDPLPHFLMPRFILQPLIENAFEHGLQPKKGQWCVHIRIVQVGSRIAILIMDNGVGMTKERLRELRAELRNGTTHRSKRPSSPVDQPRGHKGIGLVNVDSRIKLHFGDIGLQLYSRSDVGTLIVMKLRIEKLMLTK